jgi:hypothetical protein
MLKRTKGEQKKKKKARQKNHTSEKNDKANSD